MKPTDYEAVRCGMNVSKAIIEGSIDAGIGLENVQMVELEEWLADQGRPRNDVQMLRIDELAELGCCCFCSILYIGMFSSFLGKLGVLMFEANDTFMTSHPDKVQKFMKAVKRAADFVLASPADAYKLYIDVKPQMASAVNSKIFERSYAYFSRDLKNVQRDWEKVTKYGKRLGVLEEDFKPNYTNQFLDWELEGDSADPTGDQKRMAELQKDVACKGGFQRLDLKIAA
jgi:pyrimidine precursor biosynthesis enzyme